MIPHSMQQIVRTVGGVAAAILMGLTAGCSRTDNEPGPGGVTVSEAKALDQAAEMLESRDKASETAADTKAGD